MVLKLESENYSNLITNISNDINKLDCYKFSLSLTNFNEVDIKLKLVYDSYNRDFVRYDYNNIMDDSTRYFFPLSISVRSNSRLYNKLTEFKLHKTEYNLLEVNKEIKPYFIRKTKKILSELSEALIQNDNAKLADLFVNRYIDKTYLKKDTIFDIITNNDYLNNKSAFFKKYKLDNSDILYFISKDLTKNQLNNSIKVASFIFHNVNDDLSLLICEKIFKSFISIYEELNLDCLRLLDYFKGDNLFKLMKYID